MEYVLNLRRPLSYFASLLSRFIIVEKGLPGIPHDRNDGYYRCLLRLEADALQVHARLKYLCAALGLPKKGNDAVLLRRLEKATGVRELAETWAGAIRHGCEMVSRP